MEQLIELRELISQGQVEVAIMKLTAYIEVNPDSDEAFYLRGNAYRKLGDWKMALNNYLSAIELNPQGPALQAKIMMTDIMNFYNKDMYNH